MLVCKDAQLLPWTPDFSSSGQASPRWIRALCNGEQVTNALNDVEWIDEPAVQLELCESCGYAGCESGGYAHVSVLGDHVLLTPPHVDVDDPFESFQYSAIEPIRRHGAVAIPVEMWEEWRRQIDGLPPTTQFASTTRRDLEAAWRADAAIFRQFDSRDVVELARERVIAADPGPVDEALVAVAEVATWLTLEPDTSVDGRLEPVSDRAVVQTLYFDVPDTFDRPALREWRPTALVEGGPAPVFAGELILMRATS